MDIDRKVSISVPAGSWKGVIWTWCGLRVGLESRLSHVTDSVYPFLIHKCLTVNYQCSQATVPRAVPWVSLRQPPSWVCVFAVVDYRCQQEISTATRSQRLKDVWQQLVMQREEAYDILFSTVQWHRDGLEIPVFSHMYLSVWMYPHYSDAPSPIRPCWSHKRRAENVHCLISTLHEGIRVTR